MPEIVAAAGQLERIFYILPRAAREGGATLAELSESLGVGEDVVLRDLTQVTARAYYQPAGNEVKPAALRFLRCLETTLSTIPTEDVLARIEAADLRPDPAGLVHAVRGGPRLSVGQGAGRQAHGRALPGA